GRDGVMDARNYFNDDPNPKLTRTLEQFGGSLGGAIIKAKAFFFGAYEGQRYNVGNSYGGVTAPSMVHMAPQTPSNCPSGFAGDCADSIPDAIADLFEPAAAAFGVSPTNPISHASQMVSGCAVAGAAV